MNYYTFITTKTITQILVVSSPEAISTRECWGGNFQSLIRGYYSSHLFADNGIIKRKARTSLCVTNIIAVCTTEYNIE